MGRIFGTDGIRGVAGVDMTPELALDLGRAAATVVKERGNTHPHFLIGRDTRISGGMLESAIAAGLCSVGADVTLLGVITTPGVAYLARKYQADGAFVISASHNPYEYNGIKLFDAEGYKFPDSYEEEIEELILDDLRMYALVDGQDFGRIRVDNDARTDYVEYLASTAPARAEGIRVGMIRPQTLWPFPSAPFRAAADRVRCMISVELSMGQMIEDVRLAAECRVPVYLCNRVGGMIPEPEQILAAIREAAKTGGNKQ